MSCTTALWLGSSTVRAWSAQGHRIVAFLAAGDLTPVAARNVTWLLDGERLADVASWADAHRDDVAQTALWHYVNIPAGARTYDRDRDCPRQPGVAALARADRWRDCVVDRILYSRAQLADASLDRADRAEALKFLVHFVGDVHQPFHAIDTARGGNGIAVSVLGSENCGTPQSPFSCNLHSVWDGTLIARRGLNDERYLATLAPVVARLRGSAERTRQPEAWAAESLALARSALVSSGDNLDEAYLRAQSAVIDERLVLGGLRLAAILNDVLVTSPPVPIRSDR